MEAKSKHSFDAEAFLNSPGVARTLVDYQPAAAIYSQGDPSDTVLYIQHGSVKLSVLSKTGKEAVVGMLGPGDFFGEGALAGQPVRLATATAMTASTILVVPKRQIDSPSPPATCALRPLHRVSARQAQSPRSGPRRSAVQCQRKTASPHAAPARALRQAGGTTTGAAENLSIGARGNGWYDALTCELFHEQV